MFFVVLVPFSPCAHWFGAVLWGAHTFIEGLQGPGRHFDTGCWKYEFSGANDRTRQDNWTVGLNWRPAKPLRCQLNYALKQTEAPFEPDLDDNILLANVQVAF